MTTTDTLPRDYLARAKALRAKFYPATPPVVIAARAAAHRRDYPPDLRKHPQSPVLSFLLAASTARTRSLVTCGICHRIILSADLAAIRSGPSARRIVVEVAERHGLAVEDILGPRRSGRAHRSAPRGHGRSLHPLPCFDASTDGRSFQTRSYDSPLGSQKAQGLARSDIMNSVAKTYCNGNSGHEPPPGFFIHEFHRKGRGGDGGAVGACSNACGNASMPGRWIPSRAAPPYGAQLAGLEPTGSPRRLFFSHTGARHDNG
jgi:hypothetical protein